MLAGFVAGVPIRLHTVAGLPLMETKGFRRMILKLVERLTYKLATRIYPNSFGLRDILLSMKITDESKVKVLAKGSSNGIDTTFFDSRKILCKKKLRLAKELGFAENSFTFIFVGRLVKDKGVNELVQAFAQLQAHHNNLRLENSSTIRLILLGPFESDLDPLSPTTLREIESNFQIYHVEFQQDVRPYLAISDVLVLPSYREGFPNVVLQAGAMGLPCIVSNINGCNEIITNEENGWIVPVKCVESLANTMKSSIYGINDQMKKLSRKRVVENYKRDKLWHALLTEYKQFANV